MEGLRERKAEARRAARVASAAMTDAPAHAGAIRDHLLAWPALQDASVVMAYSALARPDGSEEPDLGPLLDALLERGTRVVLPRTDWERGRLDAVPITDPRSDLLETRYGLREPGTGLVALPAGEIDVILVPGIAFDLDGNRLGHGMGFYDRFLPGTPAIRCGVTFRGLVVDELPHGAEDAVMNWLVTETGCVQMGTGHTPESGDCPRTDGRDDR